VNQPVTKARNIRHRYQDPLDVIWLRAAERLGLKVSRSAEVYASFDGEHTLTLSQASDFDADDSLAQLIFHELCHALVAGRDGRKREDWGLDNTSERDLVVEHACHRVQAALAAPFGLREFFAVTTEWRDYWDSLPTDPLASADDPALPLARRAYGEAKSAPFDEVLTEALDATATIASLARRAASTDSLWSTTRERHASGFLAHAQSELRCKGCAWSRNSGKRLACRQAERAGRPNVRLDADLAACEHWEPRLDEASCRECGACCHAGFDRVELRRNDPLKKRHPELVHQDHFGVFIPRPEGRCLALVGDGKASPYRCRVYEDRPRSCAEFAIAGAACLTARRRVGVSP
jgi:hypothetical protein